MAGRGCVITVQVLGNGSNNNHDISLPVALHSPLEVLKTQLGSLTGIPIQIQVLILCDLSDPERNNDKELSGLDSISLREIGIKNNSFLTLHGVGLTSSRTELLNAALKKKLESNPIDTDSEVLMTNIQPKDANHSYNGVIQDIESVGPFDIEITSFFVAGMLGRVRVFARDRPWKVDNDDRRNPHHWWAHSESISQTGWHLVGDEVCSPSWDKPREIRLNTPVRLLPHARIGFYIHSSLPDDLGIQYQSYRSSEESFALDKYLVLWPGLGHTGSQPFDDEHGWYRAHRGLAGGLRYKSTLKGWSPFSHSIFPKPLKQAVSTMLMCQHEMVGEEERLKTNAVTVPIKRVTPHIIYNICEFMHWDWFIDCEDPAYGQKGANYDFAETIARRLGVDPNDGGSAMQFIMNYIQNQNGSGDNEDDEDDEDDEDYDDDYGYNDDDYYNHAVVADEDYSEEDDEDDDEYHDMDAPLGGVEHPVAPLLSVGVEDEGYNTSDDDEDDNDYGDRYFGGTPPDDS